MQYFASAVADSFDGSLIAQLFEHSLLIKADLILFIEIVLFLQFVWSRYIYVLALVAALD